MIIYTLTNRTNGKQYVGKTQETAQKRFRQHCRDVKKGSETAIHRAIRKYGPEAFLVETIDTANTKEELNQKEREWISKLGTFGVYNMTPGGEGTGHKISEETKRKLREKRLAYIEANPECRQQSAEWGKLAVLTDAGRQRKRKALGGNQYAKGMTYKHTDEAKAAISKAHTGKMVSEETKRKFSESRRGKAMGSDNAMSLSENRAKVSASRTGTKKMWRTDGTSYWIRPEAKA
jgi:group I intron endonuclease